MRLAGPIATLIALVAIASQDASWAPVLPFTAIVLVLLSTSLGGWGAGMASALIGVGSWLAHTSFVAGSLDPEAIASQGGPLVVALGGSVLVPAVFRARAEAFSAERIRRRSRERLLAQIDAIVWEAVTPPFRFTYVNEGTQRILGQQPSKWLEDPAAWEASIHPDDRSEATERLDALVREGKDQMLEYRMIASDGRLVWVSDMVRVISGKQRGPTLLRGRIVDVTDQKLAERRLRAMLAANRALAGARRLKGWPAGILEGLGRALGWKVGAFWQVSEDGLHLQCRQTWCMPAARDHLKDFIDATQRSEFETGVELPGRVWEWQKPAWIHDVTTDPNFPRASIAAAAGIRSAFGFPIMVSGRLFGAIEFFNDWIEEPDDDLLEMVGALGHQIGRHIEWRTAESEVAFQKALLELQSEAGIDAILVLSPQGRILSANRRFHELWEIGEVVPGDEVDVARQILATLEDPASAVGRLSQLFQDFEEDAREELRLSDGRILDVWSTPLRGPEGILYGRAWYLRDITQQRRSEQALKDSRTRLQFLSDIARELAETLDYEETLTRIATAVVPRLADWSSVDLLEPDEEIRRVAVGHADPTRGDIAEKFKQYRPDPKGTHPVLEVLRTGAPSLVAEPAQSRSTPAADEEYLTIMRELGHRSSMIVPLMVRGRVLGAITLVFAESGRQHTPEDLTLAEAVARRAALAIDNAVLFQERHRIASALQQSLLPPSLPRIPGIGVVAMYRPARDEIGGDFYDIFQYGRKRWGVVVGDVCGKGAEAAALTGLVRYTIRSEAMQEREPGRILAMLNQALYNQTGEEFCTVAYLRLDLGRDVITATTVTAGHPSPILLRRDGSIERLGEPGRLLGVTEEVVLPEEQAALQEGDMVITYTDGLVECRRGKQTFGEDRLLALLKSCRGLDEAEVAKRIEYTVNEFCDGDFRDDLALVVLRVNRNGRT